MECEHACFTAQLMNRALKGLIAPAGIVAANNLPEGSHVTLHPIKVVDADGSLYSWVCNAPSHGHGMNIEVMDTDGV
eukprot:scaffold29238_cov21-Tisochrysis_lutea.AAC.1